MWPFAFAPSTAPAQRVRQSRHTAPLKPSAFTMLARDGRDYTTVGGLIRAARAYGLSAQLHSWFGVARDLSAIKAELAKGRMVVARVQPTYLNPETTAHHFTVVTQVKDGKVTLDDPASPNGPITVSAPAFLSAMNRTGMQTLVSVGRDHGSRK